MIVRNSRSYLKLVLCLLVALVCIAGGEQGMPRAYAACSHSHQYQSMFTFHDEIPGDTKMHQVEQILFTTCLDCGAELDEETLQNYREAHSFDQFGNCTLCHFTNALQETCQHQWKETGVWLAYNDDGIGQEDTEKHHVTEYRRFACTKCGALMGDEEALNGHWEPHRFDASGVCVCGFYRKPEEQSDPLQVSLSPWARNILLGDQMGVDAQVSGGSGNTDKLAWSWKAVHEQGSQIASHGRTSSWAVTPLDLGLWSIRVTVHDSGTGESASASVNVNVMLNEKRKRELLNSSYESLQKKVTDTDIFDYTQIDQAIYLNESHGASMIGQLGGYSYLVPGQQDGNAGHAAAMLIDSKGRGVYFSCLGNFPGEKRAAIIIRYLDKSEVEQFLYKGKGLVDCGRFELSPRCNAFLNEEGAGYLDMAEYDRSIAFYVPYSRGEIMYNRMLEIYNAGVEYDILKKNCDYYALHIIGAGQEVLARVRVDDLIKKKAPNRTYDVLRESIEKNGGITGVEIIR